MLHQKELKGSSNLSTAIHTVYRSETNLIFLKASQQMSPCEYDVRLQKEKSFGGRYTMKQKSMRKKINYKTKKKKKDFLSTISMGVWIPLEQSV